MDDLLREASSEVLQIAAGWLHRQAEMPGVNETYTASQALHEAARQIEKVRHNIESLLL